MLTEVSKERFDIPLSANKRLIRVYECLGSKTDRIDEVLEAGKDIPLAAGERLACVFDNESVALVVITKGS